jgi:hypothetical protein
VFSSTWFILKCIFLLLQIGSSATFFSLVLGIPGEPVAVTSEEDIFEYIGYPYKKPSERD